LNWAKSFGVTLEHRTAEETSKDIKEMPDKSFKDHRRSDAILLLGGLPVFAGFAQAFVFLMLWRWFLLPLGLPNLTYWHSLGLIVIFSFFRFDGRQFEKSALTSEDPEEPTSKGYNWYPLLGRQYGYLLFFLAFGWVVHLLMSL
jgi:hypothetical protein